ncbi:MAG TPA: UvrB/UvrC motif-containing protein [Burkholderiaceae bacterium]|nr:UvrB/UvrC motif-containing protein [Burkholderiaceae bacterium]
MLSEKQLEVAIRRTEREMFEAARNLEFEQAARLRDDLKRLRARLLVLGGEDVSE